MYQNFQTFIERGKHRLYEIVNTFAIAQAALCYALYARDGLFHELRGPGTFKVRMGCDQFPQCVSLPMIGPLEFAMKGETPSKIAVSVEQIDEPTWVAPPQGSTIPGRQFNDVVRRMLCPHFVEFYEDYQVWLTQNVDQDFRKWPAVWQFGRRVRDAISHSGKITINDPKFIPVTWHNLVYGPAQNGRMVFEDDLTAGDVFVLMLEMSDALDNLNCPLSPPTFL